jgi:hypothetical protein
MDTRLNYRDIIKKYWKNTPNIEIPCLTATTPKFYLMMSEDAT